VLFNPENWSRISRLLDDALELDPAMRSGWLEALPPEHADLREPLRRMLLSEGGCETGDVLPQLELLGEVQVVAGDRIGPYRLIRQLGAGGMAVVWLADRADGMLRRQVALKLPRMALVHPAMAARMAHERDILAGLEHPNIARLYDAGVDGKGRPYLALEYVPGVALDAYIRAHSLTLHQRLELFLQIAHAVAFAHGRLIVHRDLKPSNILVNEAGHARLLDFGIARLLLLELSAGAHHTHFGMRALTPNYAAPEQFTGRTISAATDVYSLGVILYELLTGASPYAPNRGAPGVLEAAVLEEEPALASSVAPSIDRRALRGDLDSILAKALRKSPVERYSSVDAFAADIERHLAGQPIAARTATRWYLAKKFARRHALTLVLTATVVAALSIGLGAALWQWRAAAAQRAIATDSLAQTRATVDFVKAVLTEGIDRDESVTLDQLLARSEMMAEAAAPSDPEMRAAATEFVSGWFMTYGLNKRADALLARAIEALPADRHARTISRFRCKRATLRAQFGYTAEAIATLTAEIARNRHNPETAAYCLEGRAVIARDLNDAKGDLAFSLEAQRRFHEAGAGQSLHDHAILLGNIGYAYSLNGDAKQAEAHYRQALDMFARAGRMESAAAMATLIGWGAANLNTGNPQRALDLWDDALTIARRRSPTGDPPPVLLLNRAVTLGTVGRFDDALAALDAAREVARRAGDTESVASSLNSKADILREHGNLDAAQALLDEAASDLRAGHVEPGTPTSLRQKLFQGRVWAARGQLAEANAAFTDVIDTYTRLGCCGGATSRALVARAQVSLAAHVYGAALADAQRALDLAQRAQGGTPFSNFTGAAWLTIARIRAAEQRPAEAHEAYVRAAQHLTNTLGAQHPDTLEAKARSLGSLQAARAESM
jgi:tetratricopeptide (TPR) repeat protein